MTPLWNWTPASALKTGAQRRGQQHSSCWRKAEVFELSTEGRMSAFVAPREVLARLRCGGAKPQVKLLIGVSDPYRVRS